MSLYKSILFGRAAEVGIYCESSDSIQQIERKFREQRIALPEKPEEPEEEVVQDPIVVEKIEVEEVPEEILPKESVKKAGKKAKRRGRKPKKK